MSTQNNSPPSGNGRVLLKTPHGDIDILLHSQQAPQHCAYFMDWVASMINNAEDPPCCYQRVVKDFYLQFNLDDRFKETHPPSARLQGMMFDRAGLCAFSNHSSDQFIITLDPCDALNQKFSIFGEVSEQSLTTLKTINQLESDEDAIPDECQLISGMEVTELMTGYGSNSAAPDTPIQRPSLNTSREEPSATPATPSTPTTPSTPSTPSISITPPATPSHSDSNGKSNNQNNVIPSGSFLINTPICMSGGIARAASTVFQEPSTPAKRQKLDPSMSPKATPISRSTTIMLDQQQVFMTSHYASALGNNLCDMLRPSISRSYSAPDMRVKFQPKWPKRLVIVRHGQSEQNACLDLYQDDIDTLLALAKVRDCDIKLTDFGKWQAEQTGKYLANSDQFDVCFCSPYQRAVMTAELIAKELPYKLKIYKDNWLREKEFGRLHGLNEKAVREKFPLEYEIRNRDGKYWYRFPGGENYCDVEMRIHCFLEKLSRDYAGRSVIVVTHQVPYKLFRALFQHLDEDGVLNLEPVHNCGIQEYLLDRTKSLGGRMKLKMFNHAAYKLSDCPPHLAEFTKSTD